MLLCTALAIGLNLGTYHMDRSADYQEFNPGVYANCDGWVGGAYLNSERYTKDDNTRHVTVWGGRQFEKVFKDVDLTIGLAVGYKRYPVMPMVLPSIVYKGVRTSVILPFSKNKGGVTFSYEF
jgi:hypothetical protein